MRHCHDKTCRIAGEGGEQSISRNKTVLFSHKTQNAISGKTNKIPGRHHKLSEADLAADVSEGLNISTWI